MIRPPFNFKATVFRALFLGIVLSQLAFPSLARAWSLPEFWQGIHAFRHLLHEMDMQPVANVSDLMADPRHSFVIVLGDVSFLEAANTQWLATYMDKGGAILLATDQPLGPRSSYPMAPMFNGPAYPNGAAVYKVFDIGVSGAKVQVKEEEGYLKRTECPIIQPERKHEKHAIFQNVKKIATNNPSYLQEYASNSSYNRNPGRSGPASKVEKLAYFPTSVEASRMSGFPPGRFPDHSTPFLENVPTNTRLPFIAVHKNRPHRLLLIADQSIFINEMMLRQDQNNDNFVFAYNCIRWFHDDSPPRTRVLLYDDGKAITDFNPPLKSELPEIPMPTVDALNKITVALEEDNAFNRVLIGNFSLDRIFQVVTLAATAILLVYGFFKLLKQRQQFDTEAPLVAKSAARLALVSPILDQRHEDMLRSGNLWESARELARHCLRDTGQQPSGDRWVSTDVAATQNFTVSGNWRQRRTLQNEVRRLRQLAFAPAPVRVSPREFTRLAAWAHDVRIAFADGILHFGPPSSP